MTLNNKLNITDSSQLAREEERISKIKALKLYETGLLDSYEVGTFKRLSQIHEYLFGGIYEFAGKMRDVYLAKGNFRFAPLMYLNESLKMYLLCLNQILMKLLKNIRH